MEVTATMTMRVDKIGARWIARSSYEQRAIPKAAGFRWDAGARVWYTTDEAVAAKLASPDSVAEVVAAAEAKQAHETAAIEASRAADWTGELPCPEGLEYLAYQRAGIAYAMERESTLFGDEMGLGKTIQAIGVLNADPTMKRVLIICPASLRLNWQRELKKWLARPMTSVIADGKFCPVNGWDILIVNYDIADKHSTALRSVDWDCMIVDEAHYLKNNKAKRTIAVLGKDAMKGKPESEVPGIKARRKLFLTGTPIPNRPIEGWTIFHAADPKTFASMFGYAKRYCAAHQNRYGWDFSGASHLDELQNKLRASVMVRRLKRDVLTELPAKRRSVIEVPANGAADAIAREQEAYARHEEEIEAQRARVELAKAASDDEYENAVNALRDMVRAAFTEMSKIRHETAVAKIPYVIDHLRTALEDGSSKVVCFAHHKDVVQGIMEALREEFRAVKVTGEDSMTARQAAVDGFQNDPDCRLFVGNIQAAGVGLTLTASAHVVFAELDWVPGNVTQAEDRCHRIGQRDMVLVEHIVIDGSLDARMAQTLIAKQRVIDEALDKVPDPAPAVPHREREHAATEGTSRAQVVAEAPKLTAEQIAAIHEGLQMLAAMDQDRAREVNGYGFSKMDCAIGHSLANAGTLSARQAVLGLKLVTRYRRQLGAGLIARAKGTE